MPRMRAVSRAPAPWPPSAVGTVSANSPASASSLKFSCGKLASRSCCAARAANSDASARAQSYGMGVASTGGSLRTELLIACGIQSEQAKDVATQLRQFGIAAVPGVRTIDRDIGLDARGTVAEHDDAIGEEQGFLDVMRDQKRRESLALPERGDFRLHRDARQRVELAE